MKKVINEELKIYSCGIADITLGQTKQFLESFNDDSAIGSLTVFTNDAGDIFINADNKDFETYKKIVLAYLSFTYEESKEMKEKVKSKSIQEIFQVLDTALIYRRDLETQKKWLSIKNILGEQYIPSETELDMIDLIYSKAYDAYMARVDLYNYAYIQGKRAERARRKKGLKKIDDMKPSELYNELEIMRINDPERFDFLKAASTLNSEQLNKLLSEIKIYTVKETATFLNCNEEAEIA